MSRTRRSVPDHVGVGSTVCVHDRRVGIDIAGIVIAVHRDRYPVGNDTITVRLFPPPDSDIRPDVPITLLGLVIEDVPLIGSRTYARRLEAPAGEPFDWDPRS
jgi:hypothetical protein